MNRVIDDSSTQTLLLIAYAKYLLGKGTDKQKSEFYRGLLLKQLLHNKQLIKVD